MQKLHGLVTFQLTPEAEEYNKTRAALAAMPPASGFVEVEPTPQEKSG